MKKILLLILFIINILTANNLYRIKDIRANNTLSIREKSSIDSKKIGDLPYNFFGIAIDKCIKVNTKSRIKNWCKIIDDVGWIAKKYIEKADNPNPKIITNNKTYKVIKVKKGKYLNIREGIGKKYKIIGKLPYNSKNISIMSCIKKYQSSSWCYITKLPDKISDAHSGWINKAFIQERKQNRYTITEQYRYQEANSTIKYLEKILFSNLDNPNIAFKVSILLGKGNYNISKYLLSIAYYKLALTFSKHIIIKDNMFKKEIIYHHLGNSYFQLNDYENALDAYLKAITISNEIDHTTLTSFGNIGVIYAKLEDHSKAILYYHKALKLFRYISKEDYPNIYGNMGISYLALEQYDKAFFYIEKALKIRQTIFPNINLNIATSYRDLGLFYNRIGRFEESVKFHKKALDIQKIILNPNHLYLAQSYKTLANSYTLLGKFKKSLKYINKALIIYEKQPLAYKKSNSKFYQIAASILLSNKNFKQSYLYINHSIDIFIKNLYKNYLILDEKQKQKYTLGGEMLTLLVLANQYILHLQKENNLIEIDKIKKELLTHYLRYKGIVTESSNLPTMLYESADNETRLNIDKLKKLTIQLSNLSQNKQNNNRKQITNMEEEISQLQIKLNKNSAKFREFKNLQKISYKNISKILKKDELYIDFAMNNYIFTLDKSNNITFHEMSEKETKLLKSLIQKFRKNNKSKASKNINETQQTLNKIYNILDKYINFKAKKSLIISPDGLLNFLPFEALYDGDKYLIESVNISYIPSGRELVRQSRREDLNNSKDIIVFTHPDYDLTDKTEHPNDYIATKSWTMGYLADLNGSKDEAKAIKSLYPKTKIYQDKEATIVNLFKIKSPKILHISTHGKFVDDNSITNPMQQTFLAFVDANLVPRSSDYRGIATALKLSSLNLNNTELVFLSACETGLGKINQAEGVQGLPKAFIQAGAKNVIMSLWQVNDKSTTTLTRYFYENIKSGMSYKEALMEAKLKMITMHPYYWSAFILSGV